MRAGLHDGTYEMPDDPLLKRQTCKKDTPRLRSKERVSSDQVSRGSQSEIEKYRENL